jgi:hypothetical protein
LDASAVAVPVFDQIRRVGQNKVHGFGAELAEFLDAIALHDAAARGENTPHLGNRPQKEAVTDGVCIHGVHGEKIGLLFVVGFESFKCLMDFGPYGE